MKKFITIATIILTVFTVSAQKVFTKNGNVSFHSKATLENIDATSNQVTSVLTISTGDIQFSLLTKSFHFDKALMEEHFNDDYIESDKFPKATFKGKITDVSKINFAKDGTYPVTVSGDLTIHGVTKAVTTPGSIIVKGGKPSATASFDVKLADYNIIISKASRSSIAENVTIKVNCLYDQKM